MDYFTQSQSLLQIPLLDEGDDHLARVYNQMLRFVDRDLSKVMTLAEKVSVKAIPASIFRSGLVPTTAPPPSALDASEGDDKGFRILANVVWAELGTAIMDELGSVVFAAGKPDEFRKVWTLPLIRASLPKPVDEHSITKRRRPSCAHWSISPRPSTLSKRCARILCISRLAKGGSCRYTISSDGRTLRRS